MRSRWSVVPTAARVAAKIYKINPFPGIIVTTVFPFPNDQFTFTSEN